MAHLEIYMASDHAGVQLRQSLAAVLTELGHIVHDLGPECDERVDYPDYGAALAKAMMNKMTGSAPSFFFDPDQGV